MLLGCDTSKTYLLSRTLLLLFPLYLVCSWIKLTRTNAVFSRIALVSSLCAETQLLGKYETNLYKVFLDQKTHGAKRKIAEGPRGAHSSFDLKLPYNLKTPKIVGDDEKEFRSAATFPKPKIGIRSLRSGTRPERGIGRDHHRHHHQRLSINHP